jgi:hypothetical protein
LCLIDVKKAQNQDV